MTFRSLSRLLSGSAKLPPLTSCLLAVAYLLILMLSGCRTTASDPVTPSPQVTRSPRETGAGVATVPTVTALPTVGATPAMIASPSATPCTYNYFFTPAPPGCPQEAAVESAAAEQPFTGGVMIWLEATGAIYVFYRDGRWQRFADTWREGEPEGDPALAPPPDHYEPVRGFGKVWREHPAVQEQLGWATSPELGYTSQIQRPGTGGGAGVLFVRTFNGQVFYLNEREPDGGEWGIAASW